MYDNFYSYSMIYNYILSVENLILFCRLWMVVLFAWMKQERVDAPEAVIAQADVVVEDSRVQGVEVGVVTPEVITCDQLHIIVIVFCI